MKKPQIQIKPHAVLDPVARFSEIIFGLIMALSFTCSISVAESGREDIRLLLIAALGCNIAWGIVDGVMFWITRMVERTRHRALGDAIRAAPNLEIAEEILSEAMPEEMHPMFQTNEFYPVLERMQRHQPNSAPPLITWEDLKGGIYVALLVILTTFPVVLPFIFFHNAQFALRLSNAIAIVILFLLGVLLARFSGQSKFWMGLMMVGIGVALVLATIALGG